MIAFVIGVNFSISLLCFYVAWRIWHLNRTINQVERLLTRTERQLYSLLSGSPASIQRGQQESPPCENSTVSCNSKPNSFKESCDRQSFHDLAAVPSLQPS
ncbi:MAG: hypothetical protein HC825_09555 [Oscillatoriales cyanobacterium RM1_1_9]|nr:hypothetical protein [Oscillatoriales cyanobacterium RM1_1_9]